jgi:hypothetical protein
MQHTTEKNRVRAQAKQRPKRKVVHFRGSLITGGIQKRGYIVNISTRGIGMYIERNSGGSSKDYASGTHITLEFIFPTGEPLTLNCTVKWIRVHDIPQHGIIHSLGMELIDPPVRYTEFLNTLT